MADQEPALIITVCGLFLGWLAVFLRLFVRIRMLKSFGWDDCFIVLSTVFFSIFGAFTITATWYINDNGTGTEAIEDAQEALKYQSLGESCYTLATCALKVSIALLLLRLSQKRRFIYPLYFSIAFTVTFTFICFFLTLFQCQPIAYAWDKSIPGGTCLSVAQRVGIGYSYAVMAIITDWFYAILPVFIVISIKMNKTQKLYVMVVLGLGALACIATIIRTTYILQRVNSQSGLTPTSSIFIWTVVELSIGTIAASIATLRPLLQYFKFAGLADNSHDNSSPWPRDHSSWRELSRRELGRSESSRVQEERVRLPNVDNKKSATASEEALCESNRPETLTIYS